MQPANPDHGNRRIVVQLFIDQSWYQPCALGEPPMPNGNKIGKNHADLGARGDENACIIDVEYPGRRLLDRRPPRGNQQDVESAQIHLGRWHGLAV